MYQLLIKDYAKYPFLESFSKIAGSISFMKMPLHELLETPDGKKALQLAQERILVAMEKREEDVILDKDVQLKISSNIPSILSYGLARMISSCTTPFIIDKFINNEAERAIYLLNHEIPQIREAVDHELKFDRDRKKIHLTEYLPLGMIRYGSEYKLVNCEISKGFVNTKDMNCNLILKEKIKKLMMKKMPLKVNPDAQELFKPVVATLMSKSSEVYKDNFGEVTQDDFPPCMKNIIASIQKKENPTHFGRFALVTFCHKIGMQNTEIVPLFQTVKDFEVSTSLYQIEHITGAKGGTVYATPACASMKTNNLCRSGTDPICNKIKHPVGYYSALKRRKRQKPL